MSDITTARKNSFRDDVMHLAQQKQSRLRNAVAFKTVDGKTTYHDQLAAEGEPHWQVQRHEVTPVSDPDHRRRALTTRVAKFARLIDKKDKMSMVWDPQGPYVEAGKMTMGRAIDDVILSAVDAVAKTGEEGTTDVSFTSGNIIAITVRDIGVASADYGLNIAKCIEAKHILDSGDVDPDEPKYMIINSAGTKSLLYSTKVTSRDYSEVLALHEGKVDNALGFKFIRTERIRRDGNNDFKYPFWVRSGILLGIGQEVSVDVGPRRDLSNAMQIYMDMDVGATRMEEAKVGYVLADPTNHGGS